jgi:FG-GAP-like repeat/Abnormal spindle-like microcephaly-assoc'd, ASPM-SPD-2-Hydin
MFKLEFRKTLAGVVLAAMLVAAVALTTYAASVPVPIITFISPVSAASGGAEFMLTVNGGGFVSGANPSAVEWNGTPLATIYVSSGQLTATAPAALIASGGTAWITVANPSCGGACSLISNVIYFPVGVSSATLNFGSLTAATLGGPPSQMAEGDFNGDGKLDLAVSNSSGNTVSIFLGNEDGTFQPAISFNTTTNPRGIAVGDLNGDGIPDLVIGANSAAGLTVAIGDGLGGFTATTLAGGECPTNPVLADINHDGNLDIVVGNECGNGVGLFLGNGDGSFQSPTGLNGSSRVNSVVLADFDGDGNLDIAAADANSGTVDVYLGTGAGTFSGVTQYPAANSASSIATADFDGDGKLDLVVASGSGSAQIVFMHGNGDGTFAAASNIPNTTGLATVMAIGDLNIDGNLDIVGIDTNGNLQAWLGNGNGTFQPTPQTISTGNSGFGVLLGNFASDGGLNVAAGFGSSVYLYLPALTISPTSINFGDVNLDANAQQIITITNSTPNTVNFTEASFTGIDPEDFSQTNTCNVPLKPTAICSLTVTFAPFVAGARDAVLLIADNAPGSPQAVTLNGTALAAPLASLSATSLTFGNENLGVTSSAQFVLVTNTGTAPLTGLSSNLTGTNAADFTQATNCPDPLVVGAQCFFSVAFAPTDIGSRSAKLQLLDNAPDSPQIVMLSGTGILSPSLLAFTVAPPISISAGSSIGILSVAVENTRSTVVTSSSASIQVTVSGPNSFSSSLTQLAVSGVATFNFGATLLNVIGQYTVTATSANLTSATATTMVTVQSSPEQLRVNGFPSPAFSTVPYSFAVSATDIFGNPITTYLGTIRLSSTDASAVLLPSTYTFVAADLGTHAFSGTLVTLGTQSISATDQTLLGTEAGIVVSVPPNFIVNTLADDSGTSPCDGSEPCSLRSAINQSNSIGAGSITVDTSQFSGNAPFTSTLTGGVLVISSNTSIAGPGATQFVISANGSSSVFQVDAGATVSMNGLTATAGNSEDSGGGITNAGTLMLSSVAVTNSTTSQNGGGIYSAGTLVFYEGTISGNTAAGNGGGIDNGGLLTVPQSTLSGNMAADGAGIENESTGSLTLVQSTISANSATSNTGATISNLNETDGATTILDSVVAGNTAPGGDCLNCGAQVGFNLFDIAAATLQLAALAANGGPTQTMVPLPGSPVIGAGSTELVTNSGVPQPLMNDQRGAGFPRVVNGSVDLGSVQSNSGPVVSMALVVAASAIAGEPFSVNANVFAAGGNPAATFTDTVHFTSSDAQAILPADYAYVPADNGSHVFSVTLRTSGSRTVSVTDTKNISVSALQSVAIAPAAAAGIVAVAGSGQTAPLGATFASPLQAKVSDSFGNGVPAIPVIFTAPTSGASGTFSGGASGATIATDSSGTATAPEFTANSSAGEFAVTAAVASLTSAQFTLTNVDTGMQSYTLTANPAVLTIAQGQSGNTVLTFTPSGGFAGSINLSCSALPANADCVFTPALAVMSGNNAVVPITLTVNTARANGQLSRMWPHGFRDLGNRGAFGRFSAILGLLLAIAVFAWRNAREKQLSCASSHLELARFALLLVVLAGAGLTACGGVASQTSSSPQAATPLGSYAVNITATGAGGTQTTIVMINIVKQ